MSSTPPASTYRVQVRPDFGLDATAQLTDYLRDLGVSHLYTSPLLTATPGSQHGYDVADPTAVNPELGGEEGRRTLVAALRDAGLALVVDIVPNHTGIAVPAANPAWWDVLQHGRDSHYASWFDIDWSRDRIVVPILADEPGALDQLKVTGDELHYYDHRFPIAPGTRDGSPREVHDRQHYELVSWRRGDTDLNYRRFFSITSLAGLRVDDPAVFEATHAEILRWYADGDLQGIRVDHPDGLRDPGDYLRRLHEAAPDAWLVVEKILEPGERLPDWPVDGTTGYDALAEVDGVFVDRSSEAFFDTLDRHLTGHTTSWTNLMHGCKHHVATTLLAAELSRLAALVPEVPDAKEGLAELAACFPVYRSYLPSGSRDLAAARSEAGRRRPHLTPVLDRLTGRLRNPADELAVRFQQYTGAVMAKGVEDTAFYRWTRFTALNEVGGDPHTFGLDLDEFHQSLQDRQRDRPRGMTTLSTHDTKRSEDVRARLAVLAELPGDWTTVVHRWVRDVPLPDPALAHLIWQTAVGAWPIDRERLRAYALKAAREAAVSTSWTDPDEAFERALREMVDGVCDLPEVADFAAALVDPGRSNALGAKLIQLTMPGVPDVYQGTELWDNSLVDPDNRRPVDFGMRRDLLRRLDDGWIPPIGDDGAVKLLVTSRALRLRRDRPQLFTGYRPVWADGPAAEHAVVFDRGGAITVATRLPVGLLRHGGWRDTVVTLDGGPYTDLLTGAVAEGPEFALGELLATYPVALLVRS